MPPQPTYHMIVSIHHMTFNIQYINHPCSSLSTATVGPGSSILSIIYGTISGVLVIIGVTVSIVIIVLVIMRKTVGEMKNR